MSQGPSCTSCYFDGLCYCPHWMLPPCLALSSARLTLGGAGAGATLSELPCKEVERQAGGREATPVREVVPRGQVCSV